MNAPSHIDSSKLIVRLGGLDDVRPFLEQHGANFFHEVGFDQFSTFDIDRGEAETRKHIKSGFNPFILAEIEGEIVGLISYTLVHVFSARPIAILWAIYVPPSRRQGKVAQLLLNFAIDLARGDDACAFFATIPPPTMNGAILCDLFRRNGFADMAGALSRRL
jgi:GNAT superfamily N-acetyltransferase